MTWSAPVAVEPSRPADASPVPVPKPAADKTPTGRVQAAADGFGFKDFLDVINPLQHIPGISELYRAISGDRISDGARYSGNALYGLALGGPVGFTIMTGYSIASSAIGDLPGRENPDAQAAAVPVPPEKPVAAAEPTVAASSATQGEVLGAEVARTTGPGSGTPFDLTALLTATAPDPKPDAAPAATPNGQETARAVSPEEGLAKIAAHKANHLPVDVLKALQERHLARANDEPA